MKPVASAAAWFASLIIAWNASAAEPGFLSPKAKP